MKDLGRLTLEERVGQMFVLGFSGTTPEGDVWDRIQRIRPGGIVFQQRNIESLDQIASLTLGMRSSHELPLVLAVNQEGGAIDRFKHVLAPVPSPGEVATAGVGMVRATARLIVAELAAAGFNVNLAPVLDLGIAGSVHPERALADSAAAVGRIARPAIDEARKKGILSCARHFPGLGSAPRDPHFGLPRIDRPRRRLFSEDIVPFNELKNDVDMILVGHGHYPTLGDLRPVPASLSPRVVAILRDTVRFEGVAITDDLTMGAVTTFGLKPETFVRAVEAGNDMIQFSQATPLAESGFQAVLARARTDRNFRRRVDESVDRILDLKRRLPPAPAKPRPATRNRLVRQIEKLREFVLEPAEIAVR